MKRIHSIRFMLIVWTFLAHFGAVTELSGSPDTTIIPGALDKNFNAGWLDGTVSSVATTSDGKLIIGGNFERVEGYRRLRVARLNQDGSVDVTFDPGGNVTDEVNSVAVTPDGSVLVGGNGIIRLLPNGSIDPKFKIQLRGKVLCMELQSNGKVMLGGEFDVGWIDSHTSVWLPQVIRLNQDGSLDSTFVKPDFQPGDGPNGRVTALAVQPDGRVLIAGDFTKIAGISCNYLARLNSNGLPDVNFDAGKGAANVAAIALQHDGRILIGGWFSQVNGTRYDRLARLNGDGTIDSEFPSGFTDFGNVRTVVVRRDGKIAVAGSFDQVQGVPRHGFAILDSNGLVDPSFDAGSGVDGYVKSLAVLPDSRVVLAGRFSHFNGTQMFNIAILHGESPAITTPPVVVRQPKTASASAQANVSFSVSASGTWPISYQWRKNGVILSENGRIRGTKGGILTILGAQPSDAGVYDVVLTNEIGSASSQEAELNVSPVESIPGTLETNFNAGFVDGPVVAAIVDAEEKIVVAGNFTTIAGETRNRIARLNLDGSIDPTFNPGSGFDGTTFSIQRHNNGGLVVGGAFKTFDGVPRNNLARLKSDGSLDLEFPAVARTDGTIYKVLIQSDGKLLLGGDFSSANGFHRKGIARLNADGTLDSGFIPDIEPTGTIREMALQADGKILVAGIFAKDAAILASEWRIIRLHANGKKDSTFTTDFLYSSLLTGPLIALAITKDGELLTGQGANPTRAIAKLLNDGKLDPTFSNGGPFQGSYGFVTSILPQPSGKILIGGFFTTVNGLRRNCLARLNEDGTLDTSYASGAGVDFPEGTLPVILTLAALPDGGTVIGGSFSMINGVPRYMIARLRGDRILTPPVISEQPLQQVLRYGMSAQFSVMATDSSPLTYQWRKQGIDLPGQNGRTLTLPAVHRSDEGTYSVAVSNSGGTTVSSNAVLTVQVPQRLTLPHFHSDGRVIISFSDDGNLLPTGIDVDRFEVQASADLRTWATLHGTKALIDGTLVFEGWRNGESSMTFYRVIERSSR